MSTPKQQPGPQLLSALVMVGLAAWGWHWLSSDDKHTTATPQTQEAAAAEYATPDIARLSTTHRAILAAMHRHEDSTRAQEAALSASAKRGDRLGMFQALRAMRDAANEANDSITHANTTAPKNERCAAALADSLTLLGSAYLQKAQSYETAMAAVDGGEFRPSQLDDLQQRNQMFSAMILRGTSHLVNAYSALGYPPDAIDAINGGLLESVQH